MGKQWPRHPRLVGRRHRPQRLANKLCVCWVEDFSRSHSGSMAPKRPFWQMRDADLPHGIVQMASNVPRCCKTSIPS